MQCSPLDLQLKGMKITEFLNHQEPSYMYCIMVYRDILIASK